VRAQDAAIRASGQRPGRGVAVATVQVPELNIGVFTSNDGRYTIQVPAARVSGQVVTLRVRTIGHNPGCVRSPSAPASRRWTSRSPRT